MSKNQDNDETFDDTLGAEYRWQVAWKNPHMLNDSVHADNVSVDESSVKFYLKNGVLVYFAPYDLVENIYIDRKGESKLELVESW
jgi:hypothetical protein